MKYRLNALAVFSVNIEIEANSREEAFAEYDRLREQGKLSWQFVDT